MIDSGRAGRCGAVMLLGMMLACGDDDGSPSAEGSTSTPSTSTSIEATGSGDETSAPVQLDAPYGPCAGSMAPTECSDAADQGVVCIERDDGGLAYSVCAVPCSEDGDCPPAGAGNVTPVCSDDGRCVLECYLEAETCAEGTQCIEGEPPICMVPQETFVHPDPQSFCETACGPCGATLFLPWTGDCETECVADLEDCDDAELEQALGCTGGDDCPAGGAAVGTCLEPIACVQGS